ncbi:unnamed protein product [Adineta ricciae]|uniref:SKP1-like protein n=1 Tax=Adineta ricciae TaxID=249248 RepID=A0A814P2L9_ADIRI|nr:unnamed protein product [Adineta ricciae]
MILNESVNSKDHSCSAQIFKLNITSHMATRTIKLKSNDSDTYDIDEEVAKQSQLIKEKLEDFGMGKGGPMSHKTMLIQQFRKKFLKVDQGTLFGLITAINYLNITGLLNVTCKIVAHMLRGKNIEEIRREFNIKNDFTPQESLISNKAY